MNKALKRWIKAAAIAGMAAMIMSGCTKEEEYVEASVDIADSFPIAAEPAGENPQLVDSSGPYAILHTTAGDITILLYPEQAPKAVENFVTLAKEGYYDGTLFHYAKRNELTQTGFPGAEEEEERSIWGEPFEDEIQNGLYNFKGAVGMAGLGANNNLSQFYLLVQEEIPEDERIVPASMYMNEIIIRRTAELQKRTQSETLSDEELEAFEEDVNAEIQAISTDWMPAEDEERFRPVMEQYKRVGGNWNLDYQYTVFGQIVEGLNVAEAITQVKVEAMTRQPKKDVVIESIEIRE